MMHRMVRLAGLRLAMVWLVAVPFSVGAGSNIASTVHNLTPTGPGNFKAPESTGLCVFCHTPHSSNPQRSLWNRELSAATYELYTSSTLLAQVKQPTGSSRLCLSCHDGTLAMGNLLRPGGVRPTLGFLTGKAALGTNLSADHPVSFVYDAALATARGELAFPSVLTGAIKLDQNHEMQCTSCHDAHEDRHAKFMRMDTRNGALCVTCHKPTGWENSTHATSSATWNGTGTSPWPGSAYPTVAENACSSCHKPHTAGHAKALLAQPGEVANCMVCHGGAVAARNLQNEFSKLSSHPISAAEWTHTPNEKPMEMARHVTCADCHNPHASNNTPAAVATDVTGRLLGVRGISQAGGVLIPATKEYEVCYKCHGLSDATTQSFQRQDNNRNVLKEFDPSNQSYHPVVAVGKNAGIQNLVTGYTASSRLLCSSCHNNDAAASGGTAPAGPHGSQYAPILERQYDAADNTIESPQSYALCYKCHDRNALTIDVAGKFPHARHLAKNTSCASCHDAHGSRYNPRLINFMLFDKNGLPVVSKSTAQQRLEYIPSVTGGQCYLSCHGVNHEPSTAP